MITNCEEGKGKPPQLFPKTGYTLGYPEPALQQKTDERERKKRLALGLELGLGLATMLASYSRVDIALAAIHYTGCSPWQTSTLI